MILLGTKVRYSTAFRKKVGLILGKSEVFTVVACNQLELDGSPCGLCASGRHVAVNAGRHIAIVALNLSNRPAPVLPAGVRPDPDADNRGGDGFELEIADDIRTAVGMSDGKLKGGYTPAQCDSHRDEMRRNYKKVGV